MSSMHLTTITGALEQQMSLLLQDIASIYELDYQDLHDRYLGDCAPAPPLTTRASRATARAAARNPAPRAKGRRVKLLDDVPEGEPTQEILESVKLPGLKRFCKAQGIPSTNAKKNELIERCLEFLRNPAAAAPTKKKGGRRKKGGAPEPVCAHSLNAESHGSCSQCVEYGNVFGEVTSKKKDWTLAMSATRPSGQLVPEPTGESQKSQASQKSQKSQKSEVSHESSELVPEDPDEPEDSQESAMRAMRSMIDAVGDSAARSEVKCVSMQDGSASDDSENAWVGYNVEPSQGSLCASDYI